MRRAVGILSIAVVPLFAAVLAFAADPYGTQKKAETLGTAGVMGEHAMTGRITSIDKEKGRVTVDAQGEELDLHFPPSALRNLNKGDQVTVSLGIRPVGGTSGTSGVPGSRGGDMPHTGDMEKPGSTER